MSCAIMANLSAAARSRRLNHILTVRFVSARGERKPILDHVPTMVLTIDFPPMVSNRPAL
jgi:hypothetical protein